MIGFCAGCGLVREDTEDGVPVSDCACTVAHHHPECAYRKAVVCPISVPCDLHTVDACPTCYACDCGAAEEPEPRYRTKSGIQKLAQKEGEP